MPCRAVMTLDDLQPHQVIRSLLDEVLVRCKRACGWTGRRDALAAHNAECPVARFEAARAELAQFDDVSKELVARDERIASLEARIAEQDRSVIDVSRQLLARDVRIKDLEALVARQNVELAALRKCLSHQEANRCEIEIIKQDIEPLDDLHVADFSELDDMPSRLPPPEPCSTPSGTGEAPEIEF